MFYFIVKKINFNCLIHCQSKRIKEVANEKQTVRHVNCIFWHSRALFQAKLWHPYWFPIENQYQLCWYMSEQWLLMKWTLSTSGESCDNTKHIIFTCMSAQWAHSAARLKTEQLPAQHTGIKAVYDSILAFINRILIKSVCLVWMGWEKKSYSCLKLKACLMLTLIFSVTHLINGIVATLSLSASSWIRL